MQEKYEYNIKSDEQEALKIRKEKKKRVGVTNEKKMLLFNEYENLYPS